MAVVHQSLSEPYGNADGVLHADVQDCRVEAGGGSYGTNSGGFDHTGFGTLMHSDETVTEETKPTVLSPEIVQDALYAHTPR